MRLKEKQKIKEKKTFKCDNKSKGQCEYPQKVPLCMESYCVCDGKELTVFGVSDFFQSH